MFLNYMQYLKLITQIYSAKCTQTISFFLSYEIEKILRDKTILYDDEIVYNDYRIEKNRDIDKSKMLHKYIVAMR